MGFDFIACNGGMYNNIRSRFMLFSSCGMEQRMLQCCRWCIITKRWIRKYFEQGEIIYSEILSCGMEYKCRDVM